MAGGSPSTKGNPPRSHPPPINAAITVGNEVVANPDDCGAAAPSSTELESPGVGSSGQASPSSSIIDSPKKLPSSPSMSPGSPTHLVSADDLGSPPGGGRLVPRSPGGSPSQRWSGGGGGGGGEKGKYMVMGVLSSALDLAKAAVAHDEQQAPPEKVLPYYKKAIRAIDTALKLLPEDVAESTGIKKHRDAYQGRVTQLKQAVHSEVLNKDRRSRQQSRVPFQQLELDPDYHTEQQPADPSRRAYWVMRLVRQTITSGGHLTPRLFVPKGVWAQVGVRFSGFAPKIAAMETILYMTIDKVITLPKPPDAEARRVSVEVLRTFREQAHKVQMDLSRHFPFIVGVDPLSLASEVSPKSNLSRFNSMVKNIGRNVKNTAAVAVERIGAGIQGKVMDDELVYYSQLVSEVCGKCQVFDEWLVHLQGQTDAGDCLEMDGLLMELHLVGGFMREVICAMMLRDVENLLDRYLRKMRKSFARMYWDEDYETHDA